MTLFYFHEIINFLESLFGGCFVAESHTLHAQLLQEFLTDLFENLLMLWTWSEAVDVTFILSLYVYLCVCVRAGVREFFTWSFWRTFIRRST